MLKIFCSCIRLISRNIFYIEFFSTMDKTLRCKLQCVLALDAHTCDFVAGSAMSIRNYFQPSNGLSEPTGSISIALKSREQGTSSPPCARQLNISCTLLHCIVPPHRKISEHTRDTFRGKCCMIVLFSQPQSINRKRFQALFRTPRTLKLPLAIFFVCVVASNTTIPF